MPNSTLGERLPHYIEDIGHGAQCYTAPVKIDGVIGYGFPLLADGRLQRFIDSQLNAASGGAVHYTALGFVIHAWISVARAAPLDPVVGWMADHESMFFVPLLERRAGGLPHLTFWIPYLFIDVSAGMTTAREIHGFRKMPAKLEVPRDSGAAADFRCDTVMFERFGDPDCLGKEGRLITTRGEQPLRREPSSWSGPEAAFRAILGVIDNPVAEAVLTLLFGKLHFPMVCLKQIRDAADMRKACYQALVHAPGVLDRWLGGGLFTGRFETTIANCANYPIVHDLGLGTPGATGTVLHPRAGFWIGMDFTLPPGEVIWQAG